ncbi:membrane protein [Aliidongia dinghuensis]|uniref:Membrane protein n=1 Tax=Aliidongia dinghuensis TaxID=1867774 RepID=A0A8J3E7I2_9PROT|nr:EamA family transporter [Aliidongia dinghuensis]GGF41614.1 membrane protein [Aliidongia dinghuensis]
MPAARRSDLALLLLLALLWGASYGFIRVAVATIPPLTLVATRVTIATVVLQLVMARQGTFLPRRPLAWRNFAIQAAMNGILPFSLIAWGEERVPSGLAGVLNSTTPIFVFLITWAWTRHERAGLRQLVGTLLGLAGIVAIVGPGALSAGLGGDVVAELAIVAATVCYAVAAIFGRTFAGLPPIVPAAGSTLVSAFVMAPAAALIERPWTLPAPSLNSVLALAALGLFSTAGAFVVYFRLLASLGSVGTASVAYLRAAVSVALGILFLGELPGWRTAGGLVLVLTGVAAMTLPPLSRPFRFRPFAARVPPPVA